MNKISKTQIDNLLAFIQPIRLRESSKGVETLLEATESDKGRVINSSAFRRLQQKAQVFPLEANASVRSRLTHSIEVSHIGRYIAQEIISIIQNDHEIKDLAFDKIIAFINTVETACLLHDIGNPPFGHLGETAIQQWFDKPEIKKIIDHDLHEFDGNPQGFRLIRLLSGNDSYGLNLTCSLLLSTVKYPYTIDEKVDGKIGLFKLCKASYEDACKAIKWGYGKYFPLMLIMDSADSIAYSMSDLEDAIEKQIISEEKIITDFSSFFASANIDTQNIFNIPIQEFNSEHIKFLSFKTSIINAAVKEAAKNFCLNLNEILIGDNRTDLITKDSDIYNVLNEVFSFAKENIYSHESAEKIELAGRNIIQGLLKHFESLMHLSQDQFNCLITGKNSEGVGPRKLKLDFELRLYRCLPKNHVKKYTYCVTIDKTNEILYRSHLIVDYISGMTDDFALEMYQLLEGIRIQ
ncbi:dGTP triphosphohydrolase [Acinetobacter sp. MB5]|uniref:dGTP triphosphohydrolase n=1 Tax=Acinetobacter sp. MB5 TaxID=2069438 RepID=UPI000DD064BD|nr:dNTP triphosphohydrolase [Acinetobacter sp. MB5]